MGKSRSKVQRDIESKKMVGPVGKTPRYKLTARERQLCLDLQRREEAKEEVAPKRNPTRL
ncbi:hypothetical protein PInf_018496 [Phytophthora infestans]|nr:hypothetical protein PInf_018496 [Phytophthora infestans]